MNNPTKLSILSAIFLVAGTSIGGGMLALPVATGIGGFWPSIAWMLASCSAMTATGLLLIEVSLWMEEGVHINTMTSRMLGPAGKVVAWILYLFICYASIVAYTAGGGSQVAVVANKVFHSDLSKEWGSLIYIAGFGAITFFGSRFIGRVNAILFASMLFAYILLIVIGVDEIQPGLLAYRDWPKATIALPVILTTFSYQTMVPSLTSYLNRNVAALRWAVIGGNLLTLSFYALWQCLILGIIPVEGPSGLVAALEQQDLTSHFLEDHVQGAWVWVVAEWFAFFAIATSFLGMTLGLGDFLSDGFKIQKNGRGRLLILMMIILPTLFFTLRYEKIFITAMDTTGGLGDSILNGLIPVLMVWIGRYKRSFPKISMVPGGRVALVLIALFFTFTLTIECLTQAGWLTAFYEPYDLIEIPNP